MLDESSEVPNLDKEIQRILEEYDKKYIKKHPWAVKKDKGIKVFRLYCDIVTVEVPVYRGRGINRKFHHYNVHTKKVYLGEDMMTCSRDGGIEVKKRDNPIVSAYSAYIVYDFSIGEFIFPKTAGECLKLVNVEYFKPLEDGIEAFNFFC